MNVNILLDRLEKVRNSSRDRWVACCPAHQDKSPSLQISQVNDRILIHCFAGCGAIDVLESVGLDFSAICPDNIGQYKPIMVKQEDEIFINVYMAKRSNGEIPNEAEKLKYKRLVSR